MVTQFPQPRSWTHHIALYFGLSFVLHLIWESLQAPLYVGFGGFWQHFWYCLYATATGDMLFMLTIYLVVAAALERLFWLGTPGLLRKPVAWIVPVVIGALLAVSFELWAIHVEERWIYGSMPMIPVLRIGLMPLLQMLIIPLLVIAIAHHLLMRVHEKEK